MTVSPPEGPVVEATSIGMPPRLRADDASFPIATTTDGEAPRSWIRRTLTNERASTFFFVIVIVLIFSSSDDTLRGRKGLWTKKKPWSHDLYVVPPAPLPILALGTSLRY